MNMNFINVTKKRILTLSWVRSGMTLLGEGGQFDHNIVQAVKIIRLCQKLLNSSVLTVHQHWQPKITKFCPFSFQLCPLKGSLGMNWGKPYLWANWPNFLGFRFLWLTKAQNTQLKTIYTQRKAIQEFCFAQDLCGQIDHPHPITYLCHKSHLQ